MFGRRIIHHGRDRVQISRWRERADVASLVPFAYRDPIGADAIQRAVRAALDSGFETAYTAAMTALQARPFLSAGFELHEELLLLQRDLSASDPAARSAESVIRRARRGDWPAVIDLDHRAFGGFWHFDRQAMTEAIRATPRHRFAVTRADPVVGYHIAGVAAANLYLQRVAVDPDSHGQGWGTHLVHDAMRWGRRHGAARAHVNTQVQNHAAVALYERCGFVLAEHRLLVLHGRLGELA